MHAPCTPRTRTGFALLAACAATAPIATIANGEGSERRDGSVVVTFVNGGFCDTGDTSDNVDDFDPGITDTCPYSTSTSPEVFYRVAPTSHGLGLGIDMCGSTAYDTKIYVIDDATTNVIACNDDSCTAATGQQFVSQILFVELAPGQTYDIGIDGWSGASGSYEMVIDDGVPDGPCARPCVVPTPEGESERHCFSATGGPGLNGDCATTGSSLPLGDSICGRTGRWTAAPPCATDDDCPGVCDRVTGLCADEVEFGDLDWYAFTLLHESDLSVSLFAWFTTRLEIWDVSAGCADGRLLFGKTSQWSGAALELPSLPPGTYRVLVSPGGFLCSPGCCHEPYELRVDAVALCPADLVPSSTVGFADLNALLSAWGPCAPCAADLDGNGTVGFADLNLLLNAWGPCG